MELPEYEDYGGTQYTICRAMRLIFYVVVLVLLSYSLWRIHAIESNLMARDRLSEMMQSIAKETNNNLDHHRVVRNVQAFSQVDLNSFGLGDKELPRGGMLTAKHENLPERKKPMNKEDFKSLVNSLFDKIQLMHDDTERSHFDNNMKAVFQAWFPVFDALLPRELTEIQEPRKTRSVDKISEESVKENKAEKKEGTKTSEDSVKKNKVEKKGDDKSSEESSEEKKPRVTRSAENRENSLKKEAGKMDAISKGNEDLAREKRSAEESSDESSESFEEHANRVVYNRYKNIKKFPAAEYENRRYPSIKKKESSDESSDSSESSESSEKMRNNVNIGLAYSVKAPIKDNFKNPISPNDK